MQRFRLVMAVLLGLIGAVWLGQGLGFLPGSVMTGERFWAIAGLVAIGAGVYFAWVTVRRR
jgi:uncharacterized membrane protein